MRDVRDSRFDVTVGKDERAELRRRGCLGIMLLVLAGFALGVTVTLAYLR